VINLGSSITLNKVNGSTIPASASSNPQNTSSSEVKNSPPINMSPIYSKPIVAKVQSSSGGNYWGRDLEEMDIVVNNDSYPEHCHVNITKKNEGKILDIDYSTVAASGSGETDRSLNLLTGEIVSTFSGGDPPGFLQKTFTPQDKINLTLYIEQIDGMISTATRASDLTSDVSQKNNLQSVLNYLDMVKVKANSLLTPPTQLKVYNYPNPFNPLEKVTQIRCELPQDSTVTIRICDIAGNSVKNIEEQKNAGIQDIPWDGKNDEGGTVASGIYLAKVIVKSAAGAAEKKTIKIAVKK
jgi:hypothetical protein